MFSKLVSKADVQWSQKVPWNQVSFSYYIRWLVCIHVWSSKWKQASFISPSNSGLLNKLPEFMPNDAPKDIAAVIYSLYGAPAYPQ